MCQVYWSIINKYRLDTPIYFYNIQDQDNWSIIVFKNYSVLLYYEEGDTIASGSSGILGKRWLWLIQYLASFVQFKGIVSERHLSSKYSLNVLLLKKKKKPIYLFMCSFST